MKNVVAIDIETMPNPDMIDRLPEVKADTRLKDEEKIKADIEKKKQEQVEKMALNPLYGKIACIGYYGENFNLCDVNDEKEMIKKFFEVITSNIVVTFNGKNFDFDFIIKRGIVLGICHLDSLEEWTGRYKANNTHIDLMEKWCGYGKYISLNELSKAILDEEKIDFDVKEIPELLKTKEGQKKLKEYCLKDCELTYKLAKRMGY